MLRWFRRETTGAADLGLDLGSSRCRCVDANGAVRDWAAAVLWDLSRQQPAEAGDAAMARVGRHPRHWSFVRPWKVGVLADFDAAEHLCGLLLQGLKARPHVLAACPVLSGDPDLQYVSEMLKEAGAASVCLVPATACAAIAGCGAFGESSAVAVVQLGHELLQASLYSRGAVVSHWQQGGGGVELAQRLHDHLLRRHFLDVGETELTELVPRTRCPGDDVEEWLEVRGKDVQSGLPRSLPVAGWELSRWVELSLQPVVALLNGLIEETPPQMLQQILQDGLLVSGGLSQLNGLGGYLQRNLSLPVRILPEPGHAVLRGLQTLLREPRLLDTLVLAGRTA